MILDFFLLRCFIAITFEDEPPSDQTIGRKIFWLYVVWNDLQWIKIIWEKIQKANKKQFSIFSISNICIF